MLAGIKRAARFQVVIALVITPEGLPVAYEVMDGNTSDKTTLKGFLAKIEEQYGRVRRTWVMDRGIPTEEVLRRSYIELGDLSPRIPRDYPTIAELLPQARPLHEYIPVDAYLHGCPPTADQIWCLR